MTTQADGWPNRGAFASSVDVAEYLYLPVSTIRKYARQGVLPAVRLGGPNGPLRFRKLDIEKWVSRQPKACA